MRGFFEIGILQGKNEDNLGSLWRSANIMGCNGIFTIGKRYPKKHPTDTMNTPKHIPLREFNTFDDFFLSIPRDTKLVGIELVESAKNIFHFKHPERAIYLLGAEDHGLSEKRLLQCDEIIKIPFYKNSMNVAVTGSLVMYDRILKNEQSTKAST